MTEPYSALVLSMLRTHSVKYQLLSVQQWPQLPSARLFADWVVVFPGSASALSHVIFAVVRSDVSLLVVTFSKTLRSPANQYARMLSTAMDINSRSTGNDDVGIWTVELRENCAFPVLCTAVIDRSVTEETLWKTVGRLNALFTGSADQFTAQQPPLDLALLQATKAFLAFQGFTKVKEWVTATSATLLVVLSSDTWPDQSPLKRFPMQLKVTQTVTIRVYFSMNDSAVNAERAFERSAQSFIAAINPHISVGCWNYLSAVRQCAFTVAFPRGGMSPVDVQAALVANYTHAIKVYTWSAPLFAKLHDADHYRYVSKEVMEEYLALAREHTHTIILDYSQDGGTLASDLELTCTLQSVPAFGKYTVSMPMMRVVGDRKVATRTGDNLCPIDVYLTDNPRARGEVWGKFELLVSVCERAKAYPRVDMVYVTEQRELKVVPDKGMVREKGEFWTGVVAMLGGLLQNRKGEKAVREVFQLEMIDLSSFANFTEKTALLALNVLGVCRKLIFVFLIIPSRPL